jgi:hypothetical protein
MVTIRGMLKSDVLAHYGTSAKTAAALEITRQAVEKWPDAVPEGTAYKLQFITRGKLRVRPELYKRTTTNAA